MYKLVGKTHEEYVRAFTILRPVDQKLIEVLAVSLRHCVLAIIYYETGQSTPPEIRATDEK